MGDVLVLMVDQAGMGVFSLGTFVFILSGDLSVRPPTHYPLIS